MPTYEYRCKDCDHALEVTQSFSDDALTTCPACGGTLKKVFGNVGISFKGSGFYKNDSRGGSSKRASTSSASAASTSDTTSSSSSTDSTTSSNGTSSSSDSSTSSSTTATKTAD